MIPFVPTLMAEMEKWGTEMAIAIIAEKEGVSEEEVADSLGV